MENLLDNNFELLASELFDVPRDSGVSYLQIGTSYNNNNNNNNNNSNNGRNGGNGSARGSQQLIQQPSQHVRNSRSDSLLSDVKSSNIGVSSVDGSLVDFNSIRNVENSSKIGISGHIIERSSGMGIEHTNNVVDELRGFNITSRHSGSRSFGRIEDTYLDLDGSMNRRSSDTFSDVCAYQQQNNLGNNKNNGNGVIHSRCLNGSFSQNSHLGTSGGTTKISNCNNNHGNNFLDDQIEFETEHHIQGLIGRYNSMCIDDQILKMGTYSNCINNNMNSGNVSTNCTAFEANSLNNKNSNNNGVNANVDVFLPQIEYCNVGTNSSTIGNGLSHEIGCIERDSTECYRAHQNYIQRRFANGDFGTCNMTNTTTVSSEPSSLSGVATPGSASLKSANSTDALTQRFRNSSNINLSSYDMADIQGSNGINFDKLSTGTIGINGYSKHLNTLSMDDTGIPLEDLVSEMNPNGKLRFRKSSGSNSNLSNPTPLMGSMNTSGRGIIGGSVCSSGSSSCSTGVGGSTCSVAGNTGSAYGMKRSSKSNSLIHSGFNSNRNNSLIIDEEDIYPSIGHFASLGSSSSQLLGVMNSVNNQPEGLVNNFKSRSGSANTDYMCRNGIDTSPSIKGNYISYGDSINGLEGRHSSHPVLNSGDIGGSFEMDGNVSQFQNMFNRLMDENNGYRMESSIQGIDEVELRGEGKSYWQHTSPYKFSSSQGLVDWKTQHQLSNFEKNEFLDDFGCDIPYNSYLVNRGQQLRHKYFGQQKLYGFPSNGNNKQQKHLKQRSGVSPNMNSFDNNQKTASTYRNGNLPLIYNENNLLRCESNILRHTNRTGKKNSSGSLSGGMPNMSLNPNMNIQNLNNQGYVGVNQGQLQYCRKTCPPNCTIPTHINGNMFRRKSGSGIIPFNGNQLGLGNSVGVINNGASRSLNDLSYSGISNMPISSLNNQNYSKKTLEDAQYNKNNRKNVPNHFKNTSTASHSCNSNMTGGMAGFGNMNIQNNYPSIGSSFTGGLSASTTDINSNDASQNGLTPSTIAALWAKAMSKTGGRTGFSNRNKHTGSSSVPNNGEASTNNVTNSSSSANLTDSKSGANDIITCARFSSFLRNNSGRLHWLRVMYHYLDTVDAKKIRETNKGDNLCMVAVDDIALEAVSRSFDPSECAYWSEPENGAFVHKNIRLAVAHKVGHRTVSSPQNYVNQILTASLDHNVSILLNTLRAIDDRVRWMSTVVNSKNGGLNIDIKSNKGNPCVTSTEGDCNQRNSDSKSIVDSGYTITVNGNATSISSSGNALSGIEESANDSNPNLSNSTKNFPGRVFTVGVREAMRCLRHKKLKALIVAPDIEGDGVEGSLRHHVIHILLQAQELNIPTIFALNRHRIGRAMGKHMRMSVLGLLSIRGVEKQFQAISHTAQLLRKLYHFCIENNLPPTEETFKKLSSSVNIN
ncbi:SECIS binding pelota RNA binding domain containing protein [Cryptosporidium ubiquitum]|uniref:SECIS binding pelota RNA binding domain containing protein n=1 Tax=Cryptosporidium ubiquitum TaxID=857276 RepID=A0A1J4MLG7_9CRYT|nr:SECIS binding pelota RNA binding domain containing protein [Cryptosporidium ubiquitum]OII74299.1 SECIS binding pelota RNA binding domain containing protein [Cryptosporidium ubiquitum]